MKKSVDKGEESCYNSGARLRETNFRNEPSESEGTGEQRKEVLGRPTGADRK